MSLAKRELWVDRPSAGIPFLYVRTGLVVERGTEPEGAKEEATKLRAEAERIARATQLEDVLPSVVEIARCPGSLARLS